MIVKISSQKIKEFIEKQFAIDGMVSMEDFEIWLEEQPRVGEWIPCSERLPEETGLYQVTVNDNDEPVITAMYLKEVDIWSFHSGYSDRLKVIAWMPLPPAYKEGE